MYRLLGQGGKSRKKASNCPLGRKRSYGTIYLSHAHPGLSPSDSKRRSGGGRAKLLQKLFGSSGEKKSCEIKTLLIGAETSILPGVRPKSEEKEGLSRVSHPERVTENTERGESA